MSSLSQQPLHLTSRETISNFKHHNEYWNIDKLIQTTTPTPHRFLIMLAEV